MTNFPDHVAGFVLEGIPHAAALRLMLVEVRPGEALCKVPYSPQLIGNPDTGVIHGGVITALLDNACGTAVGSKIAMQGAIATLDLRIDYMKAATPGEDIFAFAECFKVTRNIAFSRAVAFHVDRNDPVATCTATFMLGLKGARKSPAPSSGPL